MNSAPVTLAVDLGKTRCRAVIAGAARDVREGPGAPGLATADGVDAALEAIRPLMATDGFDRVSVGAAGALASPHAAALLARRLVDETGVPAVVASDVVTAHAGALDGAPGVLLIAGTGAAGLGIDDAGFRLIDGWGPELGDLGGGSWLGREALRAVLHADERRAAPTPFLTSVAEAVGGVGAVHEWIALPAPLARRLATLAPLVLDSAAAGDGGALDIAREAARLLTRTAVTASDRTDAVALHGGLTTHTWFRGLLEQTLDDAGRRVVASLGDALDGAMLIAGRTDLPHERLVHRAA